MRIDPVEEAINEQARGVVAEKNLEKGIKGKCLTKQQIWVPRRSSETIMVEMIDKMRAIEKQREKNLKKSRRRRRRRGPRVLSAHFVKRNK
jgi:hypothetical protein